jgi:hypothetical protein
MAFISTGIKTEKTYKVYSADSHGKNLQNLIGFSTGKLSGKTYKVYNAGSHGKNLQNLIGFSIGQAITQKNIQSAKKGLHLKIFFSTLITLTIRPFPLSPKPPCFYLENKPYPEN